MYLPTLYLLRAKFCRIDLDGDGQVTPDDLDVMCAVWPVDCAVLKKKL